MAAPNDSLVRSKVLYDPYSAEMHADPYPTYEWLRSEAPLYRNEERAFWALSRYEDVQAVSRDWETFSYAHGNDIDHTQEVFGPGNFLDSDPPKHTLLRNVVRKAFAPKTIVAATEAAVRARVEELVDEFAERGSADFADELAWPLPISTACVMLGIPRADERTLAAPARAASLREAGVTEVPEIARDGFAEVEANLNHALIARRGRPESDLLGHIANAKVEEEPISEEVATGIALVLFVASIETTASLLSNSLLLLDQFPAQREALVRDPSVIPNAVEESLRFQSPLQVFSRTTTREVELYGESVSAGSKVFIIYGSANRDERKFDRPECFDVTRKGARHLAFGDGIHHCLGAPLARLEGKIVLETILARIPSYEVSGPVERLCNHGIRGLVKLPVSCPAAKP